MVKSLAAGTQLELKVPYKHRGGDTLALSTRYEKSVSNTDFVIEAPFHRNVLFDLPDKTAIEVQYLNKSVPHAFRAVVREKYRRGGVYYVKMRRTSDVERRQLREAFRLECLIKAYMRRTTPTAQGNPMLNIHPCQIINISYTGARIAVNELPLMNEMIKLMFFTSVDETIDCEVRFLQPADPSSTRYRWWCGLRFRFSEKAQSQRVTELVNTMQQKLLRGARMRE